MLSVLVHRQSYETPSEAEASPTPVARRLGERRARLTMAVVVVLFVVSAWTLLAGNSYLFAGDFPVFYSAAQRLVLGQHLYTVGTITYLNPPFFVLLLVPLVSLPLPAAHLVWAALMFVATAFSCRLLLGSHPATPRRRAWLWTSLLSLPVFLANVFLGQNSALLLLGVALWYALMRRGHPYLAGAALGLMLVKPQYVIGPAVALLAARRWRELAGLACVSACLGVLSLALVGLDGARDYLTIAQAVSGWVATGPFARSDMQTPRALLYSVLPPDVASPASLAVSAAFIALLAWYVWHDRALGSATVALAVLVGVLAAPYAHSYDLVLLIVPWLLLGPTAPRWLAVLLVASYIAPILHIASIGLGGPAQLTVLVNVPLLVALALAPQHIVESFASSPTGGEAPAPADDAPQSAAPALGNPRWRGEEVNVNTVYLVRHGENPANLTREFSHRRVDYSLTPRGIEQARRTADHFARLPITAVYSSPLKRASETADAIAERLDLPVTILEQFREVNVGELEGQPPSDELWAFHDGIFERWFAGDPDAAFPGGESQPQLVARMRDGLREAVRGRSSEHLVIVAHGGIAVATLADLCPGADIAFIAREDIPNCAISTFEVESDGDDLRCRLVAWAACDHLA